MFLSLKYFLISYICVLCLAFIIFLIAFLILEILMREQEINKDANEKNIKDLVKKFHKKLYEVSNQRTDEILECLIEMEKLDNIYYMMVDNNYKVMSEESYIKVKSDLLCKVIQNKIEDIEKVKNKREKYKALFDEINVCKKRYPLYKNIYHNYMDIIQRKF